MKEKIIWMAKTVGLVILAAAIVSSGQGMTEVSAGASDVVVDSASFATTLDLTKWNVPNNDVTAEEGRIIFSSGSTDSTRLITKSAALVSEYSEELLGAEYTIKLKTLESGNQFLVAFGLDTVESSYGESGNVELAFENDGGVKAGLVAYDDNGEAIVLKESQSIDASLGQNLKIRVDATTDMRLTVKINGKTLYSGTAPVDLSGRMGFLTTGSCEAEISEVNIISHRYDRPENSNIVEDFESGTININTLTSLMNSSCGYYPAGLQVEEYNGSKVLMFRNVGTGYLGTLHKYSNFEMEFDVPYMLHSSIMREDGTQKTPYHSAFIISFGDEIEDYDTLGYGSSPEAVVFNRDSVNRLKVDTERASLSEKGYYSEAENTGYSVKLTVIDGQVTIYVKALKASKYDEVLNYKTGTATPLGFIHLWSNGQANFAIDNLKITNLDKNANIVEVEYKEGFIAGVEDWKYEPQEVVYLDKTGKEVEKEESGFWWWGAATTEIVVGIVIVIGCIGIAKRRKKAKKESVDVNEK